MPLDVIRSLENLVELSRECNRFRETGNVIWWRGHGDQTWELVPWIYRISQDPRYENNFCRLFVQGARTRHSGCPSDSELPAWLFLMQHHRLPTRLLDWTEAPFVAAYFACSEAPNSDGALWILNPFGLNNAQIGKPVIAGTNTQEVKPLIDAAFNDSEINQNKVLAIVADEVDLRMLTQLSAFTIHQKGATLEQTSGPVNYLQKVTIPSVSKPQILKDLDALGIRLPNLFPDLDHLAEYVRSRRFTF